MFSNSSDGTAGEKKAKRLTPVVTVERMEAKSKCLATVPMKTKTQSDETLEHKFFFFFFFFLSKGSKEIPGVKIQDDEQQKLRKPQAIKTWAN